MFFTRPTINISPDSMYREPDPNATEPGFGEVFDAYNKAADQNEALRGYWNLTGVYDDHIRKVKDLTGVELENPRKRTFGLFFDPDEKTRYTDALRSYRDDGGTISDAAFYERWGDDEFRRKLSDIAAKHPDKAGDITPEQSFQSQAARRGAAAETDAAALYEKTNKGWGPWTASVLGSVWSAHDDPVTWLTAPVGFSGAGTGIKGVLLAALKNGTANAAVEAGVQPFVQSSRSADGLDSGFGNAATAVGSAFLFGGALDATVRGAARGLRYSFGYVPVVKDGIVVKYVKRDPDGKTVSEIAADTVTKADMGDPKSIREVAEVTGLAEREPIVKTALDAMDASEAAMVKPSARIPDSDHEAAFVQSMRHITDPDHEPAPVIREAGSAARLKDLEGDLAEARADLAKVATIAMAPDAPPVLTNAVETIAARVSELETAAGTMRKAVYSDELAGMVGNGQVPREIADIVSDYVADPGLHGRVAQDLMAMKPESAKEARQAIAELSRSPEYAPVIPEPAPAPGLKTRALDDPYGPDAAAQVAALEQELAEELGLSSPKDGAGEPKDFLDAVMEPDAGTPARGQPEALDAALKDAFALADRILPEGSKVRVVADEMVDPASGQAVDAVQIAGNVQLYAKALNPEARIGHEAVHVLVTRGLLDPKEVKLLAKTARKTGVFEKEAEASYREAYASRADVDRIIDEEAAAALVEANVGLEAKVQGIVDRVKAFFERLGNALQGFGFRTADDVIEAVLSGDAAQRKAVQEWMRESDLDIYALRTELKNERRLADPFSLGRITKRAAEQRISELASYAERLAKDGQDDRALRVRMTAKQYEDLLDKFDADLPRGKPFERSKVMRSGDFVVRLTTDERHGADASTKVFRIYRGTEADVEALRQPSRQLGASLGDVSISQRQDGRWEVDMVEIKPRHRGRGVAKALYAAVEKEIGIEMRPSGILLPDGYAMWKRRNPELVKYHAEIDGVFYSPRRMIEMAKYYRQKEQYWRSQIERDIVEERQPDADAYNFANDNAARAKTFEEAFDNVPDDAKALNVINAMFALRDAKGRLKPGAKERAETLKEDLADIERRFQASGGDERVKLQAKRAALMNARAEEKALDDAYAYRDEFGRSDPAEGYFYLHESFGEGSAKDLVNARSVIQVHALQMISKALWEFRKGALTGDLRRSFNGKVKTTMENMVREAAGQNTNDPAAKAFAKAWLDVAEYLRQRFNAAGGDIGKLKNWIMPQYHNPEALLSMGQTKWVNYMMTTGVLDRTAMIDPKTQRPFTDPALRESLNYIWKNITSDGAYSREITGNAGVGALYKRHADHRFIHFKDADAWLKYQREIGGGDLYAAMIGHISTMSRDIASLERFGANPELVRKRIAERIINDASKADSVRSMYDELKEKVDALTAKYNSIPTRFEAIMAEISSVHTELDAIRAKYAPQLQGKPSKRNRAKIDKLQERLWELHTEMREEMGKNSVTPEHVELSQKISAFMDEMASMDQYPVMSKKPDERARRLVSRADEIWQSYTGKTSIPDSSTFANVMSGARNWISASALVYAPLSAVTDQNSSILARQFIGMPITSQLMSFLKGFTKGDRQSALELGIGLDQVEAAYTSQSRLLGAVNTNSITGYIADRSHAYSGLSPMTQAMKVAFGFDFMKWMAKSQDTPFDKLSPNTQAMFKRHGFTPAEWDAIRNATPDNHRGVPLLTRNAIEASAGEELAEKYMMMFFRERRYAVLEGTQRGRSLWIGDTARGSVQGEGWRSVSMLKSFPTAYTMLIIGRLYRQLMEGRYQSAAAYTATLAIGGVFFGALAIQLKNLAQGRDPEDMKDPRFWGRAFMQSGGAGIYGDFLSSAVGRNGQGLTDTLAGPVYDQAGAFIDMTAGSAVQYAKDEPVPIGRKMTTFMRKNTPGAFAPFYLRTALERMIFDELQKQVDPDAHKSFRSKTANRKRVFGNDYFWPIGQPRPTRGPNMSAAFGR